MSLLLRWGSSHSFYGAPSKFGYDYCNNVCRAYARWPIKINECVVWPVTDGMHYVSGVYGDYFILWCNFVWLDDVHMMDLLRSNGNGKRASRH